MIDLKTMLQSWLGQSLALTVLVGSSLGAIALPSPAHALTLEPQSETTLAMAPAFEQTTWQLISYRHADGETVAAWAESPATFEFQDGRVTGTTGCNRFFSGYTLAGDRLTLTPGGSTLMACFPEALAQQENAILAGLGAIARYDLTAGELRLLDSNGDPVMTLTAQTPAALTQTEWTLTLYNNGQEALVTPLLETTITATFDDAGRMFGTAGCNRYHASFEHTADTLSIGAAASTRRLCAQPEGVMQQEQAFLAGLENVASYSISGNQLTLQAADGTTLAQFVS